MHLAAVCELLACVLIARIAPEDFRARYPIPENTRIYGPPEGKLANSGERLRLRRPGPPELDEDGSERVPMITVDTPSLWRPPRRSLGPTKPVCAQ